MFGKCFLYVTQSKNFFRKNVFSVPQLSIGNLISQCDIFYSYFIGDRIYTGLIGIIFNIRIINSKSIIIDNGLRL